MSKVQDTMSTKIAIDTVSATHSIKGLTSAVQASKNAWKAQVAELKSTGDSMKSAEAKYNGLTDTVEKQKQKLQELKKRQSELSGSTAETAEKYLKLDKDIASAKRQLESYTSQQERAKKSLDYQKSGLAELQREYKNINSVTDSYVERLKAEGKTAEATRAKSQGLKLAQENLSQQLRKQEAELKSIASQSGTTSKAYREQTIRVNKTATSLAKAKGGMKEFRKETSKTGSVFKGSFLGNFTAQLATRALGEIKDAMTSVIQTGLAFNKEQDTMKLNWTNLTREAPKAGKDMIEYINQVSQHSIYASDTIDKMAQSFYHVHSSEKETKNWTKDFVALGSTLHVSNDALRESGEQFAKIVAGGKTSAEDMNVMINRFPMFGEALQKATGKSMKQLREMSQQGKLTSTQFTEALDYLGKKYKSSTDEAMNSYQGMTMFISSRYKVLTGDITASSFNMNKNVLKDLKNLLSDDMLKKYASVASKAISAVTTVAVGALKYIDDHKNTIVDLIGNLGTIAGIIGKTIWTTFTTTITSIAEMFGLVDKHGKGSVDPLKALDKLVATIAKHQKAVQAVTVAVSGMFAVKKIATFVSSVKGVASAFGLVKKSAEEATVAEQIALALGSKSKGAGAVAGAGEVAEVGSRTARYAKPTIKSTAKSFGKHALAGSSLLGGFAGKGELSGINKTIADKFGEKGIAGTITKALAKIKIPKFAVKDASKLGTVGKLAGGVAKKIPVMDVAMASTNMIGVNKKNAGKKIGATGGSLAGMVGGSKVGGMIGTAIAPGIGTAIGMFLGGAVGDLLGTKLGKKLGGGIQKALGKLHLGKTLGNLFTGKMGWEKSIAKTFKKIKLPKIKMPKLKMPKLNLKSITKNVTGFGASIGKSFGKTFSSLGKKLKKPFEDFGKWFKKSTFGKAITTVLGNVGKSFSNFFKIAGALGKIGKKLAKIGIDKAFKAVGKSVDWVVKKFKTFKKTVSKYITPIAKSISKTWNSISKATKRIWKSISGAVTKFAKKAWKDATKILGKITKPVVDGFKSLWKSAKSIWSNIYKAVSNPVKRAYKFVVKSFKAMLKPVVDAFKSIKKAVTSAWSSIYKTFKSWITKNVKRVKNFMSDLVKNFKALPKKIGNALSDMWHGAWNGVANMINKGIIDPQKKMITKVQDTINGIGKKLSINLNLKLAKPNDLPKYEKGTEGGLAMVNDQKGKLYRESYQLPNGETGLFPDKRNLVVDLPKGTQIANATDTSQLIDMMNATGRRYAKGTGFLGGVGSWFKGVATSAGKLLDKVGSMLKAPVKYLTGFLTSGVSKLIGGNNEVFKAMFTGLPNYLGKGLKSWFKKLLNKAEDEGSYDGAKGHYNPKLIQKAAGMMKVTMPAGFSKALQAVIMNESGGRSVIQSIHDDNSGGNEAGGILQYTPGTFSAFAMPGHHNRMNPLDELLAFFNNSDWKHSIGWTTIWGHRKMEWLHSGPQGHRRFANGGLVNTNQMIEVAEHNRPEMVIPLDQAKRGRAYTLLAQTMATLKSQDSTGNTFVAPDNSALEKKVDTLIDLMAVYIDEFRNTQFVATDKQTAMQVNRYKKTQDTLTNMLQGGLS